MNVSSAEFIHASRGPLMLITLGILIAVHQFGMLSFSTTWPVLIIVYGILRLLERLVRQPVPYPQPAYQQPPYATYPNYGPPPQTPPPAGGTPL